MYKRMIKHVTLERFALFLIAIILSVIGWGLIEGARPVKPYREPFAGAEKAVGWSGNRIHLANGRSVELPLIREIPPQAARVMEMCLEGGVIIDSRKNIICQIETVHADGHAGFWNINLSLFLAYQFEDASDVIRSADKTDVLELGLIPVAARHVVFSSAYSTYKQWEIRTAKEQGLLSEWISESRRKPLVAPPASDRR